MAMFELYDFRFSHYCEKARWALDYKGIAYTSRHLLPGFHMRTTRKIAPHTCLPILKADDVTIQDSTEIINFLEQSFRDRSLTPNDPSDAKAAIEWEEYLDEEIGVTLRRWFYYHTLPDRGRALRFLCEGAAWPERSLFGVCFAPIRAAMIRMMDVHAESAREAERRFRRAFDRLDQALERQPFLVGDRFSRADLTACSLLHNLCMPRTDGLPIEAICPPAVCALRNELQHRTFYQWVPHVYREHRARPSTLQYSLSPKWAGAVSALALASGALVQPTASAVSSGQIEWSLGGQGFGNDRNQADQTKLTPANASQLAVKWTSTLHGDVSSTPAVSGGVVYVTDWGVQVNGFPAAAPVGGGYLNAIDETNGAIIWSKKLADYAGETPTAVSRTSPAVVNGIMYIGDQTGNVLAINAKNGNLIWLTNIDPTQPAGLALVTQSPMVFGGKVFVGTGSNQEGAATNPFYPCCTHRGSFSALDATTGAILWTFFTEPPNSGPPPQAAGGGVFGSTAAIDASSNTVYIATGNDYSTTARAQACHVKEVTDGNASEECLDPILWSFKGAGSSNAGPAIGLDGTVYWGNGYSHLGLGTASTTFYAFSVNGK
jgi:glutathione S-transferase